MRQPQVVNPWVTMWIKPRETMRIIMTSDPRRNVLTLAMLAGIVQCLNQAATTSTEDIISISTSITIAVVVGSISGIVSLYIWGLLISWTGKLFGGRASAIEVRSALAWSSIPLIWTLPLLIPKAVFWRMTGITNAHNVPVSAILVLVGLSLVELLILLWAVIVQFKCIGEVHGFSAYRALATFVTGVLILFVTVVVALVTLLLACR